MQHAPTVIDLYATKSKILKHGGDFTAAAALADEARCMDLADRYVNSHCVKRMLQADQVSLAEKIAVLFTKDGEQHNNLHDMQCMWYELASGDSYEGSCWSFKLYDAPTKSSEEDDELSKLPASQKKKLRQKQRKAEARAKKRQKSRTRKLMLVVFLSLGKNRVSQLIQIHMERSYCRLKTLYWKLETKDLACLAGSETVTEIGCRKPRLSSMFAMDHLDQLEGGS
nr:N-alpha-acetyltransferase 16, NatA auxiliary subunit-like [Tanacetum cinerariifolium]